MTWIPKTWPAWSAILSLWIGGLWGWITHPAIWLAFGPRKFLATITAFAYTESRYNPNAYKESEQAYGILQFLNTTWDGLVGQTEGTTNEFDMMNPRLQGYFAAKYFSERILSDWKRSLSILIPFYGYGASRWEWRHIPGTYTDIGTAWAEAKAEQGGNGVAAWAAWTNLSAFVVYMPLLIWFTCKNWMNGSKKKTR
jgi:hypothetical protein